jgi:hypothetical protein
MLCPFCLQFVIGAFILAAKFMREEERQAIQRFLKKIGKKGGKARAAKHDKATLSKWAKKGGRPRKDNGRPNGN